MQENRPGRKHKNMSAICLKASLLCHEKWLLLTKRTEAFYSFMCLVVLVVLASLIYFLIKIEMPLFQVKHRKGKKRTRKVFEDKHELAVNEARAAQ